MDEFLDVRPEAAMAELLKAGEDRFGEQHGLVMSHIDIKVTPQDGSGLLIIENVFSGKGGPPRHLHYAQEEWFYAVEGLFTFEVGSETYRLQPGDCLLAPRNLPHVWAHTGSGHGRILIAFMPAGQMEAFFRQQMKGGVMPPADPQIWRAHGMQLLGPPLVVS